MVRSGKPQPNRNIPLHLNDEENFFLSKQHSANEDIDLFGGEGQLCCDIYQTKENIVVKSTIAGVDPKNLDISVSNDLLTIRGFREMDEEIKEDDFYCRECYWGTFSRFIVLPQQVDQIKAKATLKNGVLTVVLPKKYKTTSIRIRHLDD